MNEKEILKSHLDEIRALSGIIERKITIMEICGGHTNAIMKYGIRDVLPDNIRLISGPGCPVCVSSQHDIDCIIEIAKKGIPVATYGDMLRVPGTRSTLEEAKAQGCNVFIVYSATEVLELRKRYPDILFFGVGFETTAPMSAFVLKHNIAVYSVHKLIPPALEVLTKGGLKLDGFILPGHVSTIIGADSYANIQIPKVIAGFTSQRILRAIAYLLRMIKDNNYKTVNAYPETVDDKGNPIAKENLEKYFKTADSEWRGLGVIPLSGLEVKDDKLNAKKIYADIIARVPQPKKSRCRCGEILKGLIEPPDCGLYSKDCTPENPQGACMVSDEGSCAIYYMYGK